MPWVKLDDAFFDNDKIVAAGKDARDLYLAGLCYCARNLTDGFIPEERTGRLAIEAGIADGKAAMERLSTVIRGKQHPLWERVDGGYQVRGYLECNPTREEYEEWHRKKAEAGRIGGQRSAEVRREANEAKHEALATASAQAKSKQTRSKTQAVPVPVPVPVQAASAAAEESAPVRRPTRHRVLFAVISREWGTPPNDLIRGRYNRAAQNFEQAEVDPDDIPALKEAYRRRWPDMDCTPLAVAGNVPTLRLPAPNGRERFGRKPVSEAPWDEEYSEAKHRD